MSKTFTLRCESCGGPLTSDKYPLVCGFCSAENWAIDSFSFSEQRAVANLRLIHSAEATFQATFGYGNYGTAEELFRHTFIPKELAEALNVPRMANESGIECEGSNKPLSGYRFRIEVDDPAIETPPLFAALALVDLETHKQGTWNFYINETGVIRLSRNHGSLPDSRSEVLDADLEQRIWR